MGLLLADKNDEAKSENRNNVQIPQIDTRYLLFVLTVFVIICAMFTQSPSLDDAAKITLGATLNALAAYLNEKGDKV